jgi:hypothetical protein
MGMVIKLQIVNVKDLNASVLWVFANLQTTSWHLQFLNNVHTTKTMVNPHQPYVTLVDVDYPV